MRTIERLAAQMKRGWRGALPTARIEQGIGNGGISFLTWEYVGGEIAVTYTTGDDNSNAYTEPYFPDGMGRNVRPGT